MKVKSYETNNVVIAGGVDEGTKVVVLGVQKLDPAQKVRVVSSLSLVLNSRHCERSEAIH